MKGFSIRRHLLSALVLAGGLFLSSYNAEAVLPGRNCNINALALDRSETGHIHFSYCLVLGRTADAGGLQTFLNDYNRKRGSYASIGAYIRNFLIGHLIYSGEGRSRFQINPINDFNKIARAQYNAVLTREPSAAEVAGWVRYLQSLPATLPLENKYIVLSAQFTNSAEAKARYPILR